MNLRDKVGKEVLSINTEDGHNRDSRRDLAGSQSSLFSKDTEELPKRKHMVCPDWVKIMFFLGISGPST